MGQGEDNMVVWNREKFTFPIQYPSFPIGGLALWTVPVSTGVIRNLSMLARIAARDVAAKRRSTAAFDGRHHLQLPETDMARIGFAPSGAVVAEDIGDLR